MQHAFKFQLTKTITHFNKFNHEISINTKDWKIQVQLL